MKPFVQAHWSDLVLYSYAVPEDVLRPYVKGYELDFFEGLAYVSVVGFYFSETQILGVKPGPLLPKVSQFAQWNLRAYVLDPVTREPGVVFIKEFVPSPMVVGLVRQLYHENYVTAPVTLDRSENDGVRRVEYGLQFGGRRHTVTAHTECQPATPPPESPDFFFMERYWGSPAAALSGDAPEQDQNAPAIQFHIQHPAWTTYYVSSFEILADFTALYGAEWQFLNERAGPDYVTWCDGSDVAISWPERRRATLT